MQVIRLFVLSVSVLIHSPAAGQAPAPTPMMDLGAAVYLEDATTLNERLSRQNPDLLLQMGDRGVLEFQVQPTEMVGDRQVFRDRVTRDYLRDNNIAIPEGLTALDLVQTETTVQRDALVDVLEVLRTNPDPMIAAGADLELAEILWYLSSDQNNLHTANQRFLDAYELNHSGGELWLKFLNEQPQFDPGGDNRLRVTRDLAEAGTPQAVMSLYREYGTLSANEAIRTLGDLDVVSTGGFIGDIYRDTSPQRPELALEAYQAAAGSDPYAMARLAQLSLEAPETEFSLSRSEAVVALQAAAGDGEFEGYLGLIPLSSSDFTYELRLASVGLPQTESQAAQMTASTSFLCTINSPPEQCPVLPLFYVTDRIINEHDEGTSFGNEPSDDHVYMGLSEFVVLRNTQINNEPLNSLEVGVTAACGENSWFCGDRRQPLNIDTPAIQDPSLEIDEFVTAVGEFSGAVGRDRIILFFHGYNNKFNDAAMRVANLVEKAEYPAIPVFFSFASTGNMVATWDSSEWQLSLAYKKDLERSAQSCARFRPVVEALVDHFGADNVDLVAHSMGAHITLEMALGCPRAVYDEGTRPEPWDSTMFRSVVFGAPDISIEKFATHYEGFREISEWLSIYTTTNDIALKASNLANGTMARLGQTLGARQLELRASDSIDATGVEFFEGASVINHPYIFTVGEVRRDVAMVLNGFFEDTVVRCIAPDSEENLYILPRCNM